MIHTIKMKKAVVEIDTVNQQILIKKTDGGTVIVDVAKSHVEVISKLVSS